MMMTKFWHIKQFEPEHLTSLLKTTNHILPFIDNDNIINTHHYKTIESDLGTIRVSVWTQTGRTNEVKELTINKTIARLIDNNDFTIEAKVIDPKTGSNIVLEITKYDHK